jgi:deoxyribonuclease-4
VRLGAHVRRRAGGAAGAVEECRRRGAECAQIFVSNPRGWAPPPIDDHAAAAFRAEWGASGLWPLVAHAPYLVNIASPNLEFLAKSRALAAGTARSCEALGVDMLVLHAGAGGPGERGAALQRAATTLRETAAASSDVRLLVELMAGTSGAVASTVSEAANLLEAAGVEKVGVCLDTCHLFATGYALDTVAGVASLFDELAAHGLTDRVGLVHANDSMFERGGRRDRHENIGDGSIGLEGWRAILRRPEVSDLPFVLETPGDAQRQAGDLAVLRALAES